MPAKKPTTDLERWEKAAKRIATGTSPPANQPFQVMMDEAVAAARFVATYLDAADGRPGLRSAGLTASIGDEILSLHRAIQEVEARYRAAIGPRAATVTPARGRALLREIDAALGFLLGDGDGDDGARLASLRATHERPTSRDALAFALDGYAAFASLYRRALHGLGGFDAASIEEARAAALALRASSDTGTRANHASKQAIALRNKLLHLLADRVGAVRRAARFVFRAHPSIAREATSAYERGRSAARSKRLKDADRAGSGPER